MRPWWAEEEVMSFSDMLNTHVDVMRSDVEHLHLLKGVFTEKRIIHETQKIKSHIHAITHEQGSKCAADTETPGSVYDTQLTSKTPEVKINIVAWNFVHKNTECFRKPTIDTFFIINM